MGQDRVAAWPKPESSSPSPEGKGRVAQLCAPECPPAALWACALGEGLATWPLWSRHFVLHPLPLLSLHPVLAPAVMGLG